VNQHPPCGIYCCVGGVLVNKTYSITYDGGPIGTAELTREGLFYRIWCKCNSPQGERFRVKIINGEHSEDLGLCARSKGSLTLLKRLHVKHLEGVPRFLLIADDEVDNPSFVAIERDSQFSCFEKLECARLSVQNGKIGFVFTA